MEATREDRFDSGKSLRNDCPRSTHAEWAPAKDRPDVVAMLEERSETRVPELLPVLYERMSESPFAFLRGSASVMALDLSRTEVSGLQVQACGDAHVGNFGQFATPERNVIFDVNDFDETLPGPFEWDVKRFAASLEVAFRGNGVPAEQRTLAVAGAVRTYRERIGAYASLRALDIWYSRIDVDEVIAFFPPRHRGYVRRDVRKSLSRTSLRALSKLTQAVWDAKGSGDPTIMDPQNLARYGALCAWALARAHARTGDPAAISGYLGRGDRFDRAIAQFASRYGDQTEADHAALVAAIAEGRLPSA